MVDAHHHLWEPARNYHPWLCDEPPISFRYGDYSALRRAYVVADYRRDAEPYQITASVYVETEWDPRDPVGEMDYVAGLCASDTVPSVAVAQAWMDRDDCAEVLESHAARSFVRSVRHKPRANPSPRDGSNGGMTDPVWRAGFARLAPLGLRFDLQTPWWHLTEGLQLANDFPQTQIILNHTGLPSDRTREGIDAWRAAMAQLSWADNVAVKISGIGIAGQPWSADANREIVLTTLDLFGAKRCMFASNFPVDSLCGDFRTIFSGFESMVADFSSEEQEALFAGNARRIYQIEDVHD
ncbi:COG3618 Predicted metal-dependent hydrolase of the TIM-barrel fold [Rhabdaerophilaceae bacterium]